MGEPSEGFERCPGNSPFCLGMVEFNCCGTQPTEKGTSQSHDTDDSQANIFETSKAKRQKLPLHLNKEKKKALSPSSRFNITVSDAEIEKSSKGYIPKNTSRSTSCIYSVDRAAK